VVHAFKYRGMTVLAGPMASLLADAAKWTPVDLIVPVPLSGLRKRTRGYNQAELLARSLAAELGVPAQPRSLVRKQHTPPQARSADAESRRRNVAGAFACREASLAGRRVLLVDDVTTTGATLGACATALKLAGATSVHALAFARED
jgi:ComF family protein